jgi:hypothetical protein
MSSSVMKRKGGETRESGETAHYYLPGVTGPDCKTGFPVGQPLVKPLSLRNPALGPEWRATAGTEYRNIPADPRRKLLTLCTHSYSAAITTMGEIMAQHCHCQPAGID